MVERSGAPSIAIVECCRVKGSKTTNRTNSLKYQTDLNTLQKSNGLHMMTDGVTLQRRQNGARYTGNLEVTGKT